MARGDIAVSLTLPPDTEKLLVKLTKKFGTRREVIINALKMLDDSAKAVKQ